MLALIGLHPLGTGNGAADLLGCAEPARSCDLPVIPEPGPDIGSRETSCVQKYRAQNSTRLAYARPEDIDTYEKSGTHRPTPVPPRCPRRLPDRCGRGFGACNNDVMTTIDLVKKVS
ncbi:hypothetical protein GCM10010174_48970 [Kutzneria viridogrisea]